MTAAGATTADFIGPYGTASDCVNQAKSLQQLGITDSKKIMTAPLCLNSQVSDALGDWPLWTYAIASSLYGDPTDKGMPAYNAVIKRYKAEKNAPDPWHIVAFSELLTTVRFLNEVGAKNVNKITPARVLVRAKAFKGPLALGAPKIQCGKYKDAPGICNDMFQAFTYKGKFQFTRASGWIGPLNAGRRTTHLSRRGRSRPASSTDPRRTDVNEILLFLLLGLGTGATIAAIAVGIVVTYRGSGFINLAAGAIAMLAGFSFWALRTGELGFTVGTPLAVALSYVFVILVTVLIELAVYRPLRTAAPLAKLVASLGVLLTAQATMLLAFGTSQHPQPTIIPIRVIRLLDGAVPLSAFVLSGTVIAITILLWALYRWTRFGLATRAASENDVAARLAGLSPTSCRSPIRCSQASCSARSGSSPGRSRRSTRPRFRSWSCPLSPPPSSPGSRRSAIACACGLGIGMIESLIEYASTKSWFPTSEGVAWPGVKELLVFVLIVAAMFLRGASLPTRGELVEQRLPDVPRPKHAVALALPSTLLCALALVVLPYDFRQALTNSLIGIVMALSLVVITGFVGQISVVQLALAGVAGFTVSHLAVDAGIGFPLAPLAGIAAAVLLGLVTAVSALRVRGVALAVVTIAAAVAVFNFGFVNRPGAEGRPARRFRIRSSSASTSGRRPRSAASTGTCRVPCSAGWRSPPPSCSRLLVISVRRGILGQRMLAVRSNERAAAGAAIDVRNVKLIAFGISALIAGVAGTLYAYNFGSVSADRFSVPLALSLIAFAYAGGITLVSGAVFAGLIAAQGIMPYALDKWFGLSGNWFLLFGGLVLIFTLIQNPEGVAGSFYRTAQARARRSAEATPP